MITSIPVSNSSNSTSSTGAFENQQTILNIEAIYDKYAAAFYGEIKRKLYKEETSQKVMKAAFVRIYHSLDQFNTSNEEIFLSAFRLVRSEISRERIDIALNQILYSGAEKQVEKEPV